MIQQQFSGGKQRNKTLSKYCCVKKYYVLLSDTASVQWKADLIQTKLDTSS